MAWRFVFLTVVFTSWSSLAQVPTSGLVGWWPGDGNAQDVLGRNDGVLVNGVGFAGGILAEAFNFQGTNEYVEIASSVLTAPEGVTIAAWVYPASLPDTEMTVTSCDGDSPERGLRVVLAKGLDDQLFVHAIVAGVSNFNGLLGTIDVAAQGAIPLEGWTQLGITMDYFTGLNLYVNGQLAGTNSTGLTPWFIYGASAEPWHVGGGTGPSFNGRIDELMVYGRSLSATEIGALYGATKSGLPLPPQVVLPPRDVTTGLGSEAVFTVKAASPGGMPLYYQWQFNGTNLQNETNATLALSNVKLGDSGPYSVFITNIAGGVMSAAANLAVAGVVAWGGMNTDGELNVPNGLTNVVAVSAGCAHSLALKAEGTVVAWGSSLQGVVYVPAGLSNVVAIRASCTYSLALKADGGVVGWGGPLSPARSEPANLTNVIAIAAAGYFGLAIKADGRVTAWDENGYEQTLPPDWTNVVEIAGGGLHSLALRADGTVVGWGDDTHGQIDVPKDLTNAVAVDANIFHSLALKSDGTVVAWGATDAWSTLTNVPVGLSNVVAIAAGEVFNLALRADGSVVQWGSQEYGLPQVVLDLPNVVAISAGYFHGLALLRDGAPQITVQPWDLSVAQGDAPRFTAKAVGSQGMNYQWRVNGQDIPGATADSYCITNVQPADDGLYTLAVSNRKGAIASRPAKLVVNAAQPVLLAPVSMTNGQFRFSVTGAIGLTYVVETSPDLLNWATVQTSHPIAMPFYFADTNLASSARRFYRVRVSQ
jgi:hypothetical protein